MHLNLKLYIGSSKLDGHSSIVAIRNAYGGVSFDFENITISQVQRALEDLNPKKSGGWESRISPKLFKLAATGMTPSLTSLFNSCLRQRKSPTAWKMGDWTPVYKKGDKQKENNYRPITSLITIDKIFENLLAKQITNRIFRRNCEPFLLSCS